MKLWRLVLLWWDSGWRVPLVRQRVQCSQYSQRSQWVELVEWWLVLLLVLDWPNC